MKKTTLSVIIPCYNNGVLLLKMLNCCRRQSLDDWEVIIVDDGSTDATPSLVTNYIKDDKRFHFIRRDREPKGSVVCRNIGFNNSCGKYIIHFDADDLISDNCFKDRVSFMDTHPNIDYASFPAKAFTDEDKLPEFNSKGHTYGVLNGTGDLLFDFLSVKYDFSVWNNIYRRNAIENIIWDEKVKIYTDFSFIVPCIIRGLKHSFSDKREIDYYYRVSDKRKDNMCADFVSDEKTDSTIYLFGKTLDLIKGVNGEKKYRKAFFNFILYNFEKVLDGGSNDSQKKYISFAVNKYGTPLRFYCIYYLFKLIPCNCSNIRKGILYVLFFLFWGKIEYLKIVTQHIFKQ